MQRFEQIEGAVLVGISASEATYVDRCNNNEPLTIKGCLLEFDLGNLLIENPFTVISPGNEHADLEQLIGLRVTSAYSDNEEIRLIFESGSYLSVSMNDDDFTGPEAASYTPKQGNIIVFN